MRTTLPFPPSSNRYWRRVRNRIIVSPEAQSYRTQVGLLMNLEHFKPFVGPVMVEMFVYMPYPRKGDLSNYEKVILDCLQGYAYTDDTLVHELHMYRRYDKHDPRIELLIAPIAVQPIVKVVKPRKKVA